MGESIVQAPNVENKKNESLASGARLEVSVSFGRFENDSLSWEKWSSFSPNKYLEEVGKCSTPGSVAQKKAYFEAHYKKIAARKAEQLEQEKQMEINCMMKDDQIGNTSFTNTKLDIANGHSSAGVEQFTNSIGVVSSTLSDESNENASFTIECRSSSVNEAKDETDSISDSLELNKSEAVVLVQEETHLNEFQGEGEFSPPNLVQEETPPNGSQEKLDSPINSEQETGNTLENKKDKSQKMTLSKKEGSLEGTKKKPTSPLLKPPREISTPKTSKSASNFTLMSDSWSSTKKANCSSLRRSKNLSAGESKKVSPSLHMSLSLGPANCDSTSLTPSRKSLIMEKMGDKDIVKRAFKTFQNNFNQVRASGYEKSSGRTEGVPTTRPEQKLSTSLTPRKENEGIRKAAEKMDAKKAQLGRRWNTTSAGSLFGSGMDQRNAKPAPSFGLGSGVRAEKRNEFLNKSEEKSYAKEAEKARINSKSKLAREDKDAELKKLRQSLNFKATPLPGFYRGNLISKSPGDKAAMQDGAKNKHHQRPEIRK